MSAYLVFTKEKTLDKAELAIYQKQSLLPSNLSTSRGFRRTDASKFLKVNPSRVLSSPSFQQWKRRERGTTAQRTVTRECTAKKVPSIGACLFRAFRSPQEVHCAMFRPLKPAHRITSKPIHNR
jgi:hypothetical protein